MQTGGDNHYRKDRREDRQDSYDRERHFDPKKSKKDKKHKHDRYDRSGSDDRRDDRRRKYDDRSQQRSRDRNKKKDRRYQDQKRDRDGDRRDKDRNDDYRDRRRNQSRQKRKGRSRSYERRDRNDRDKDHRRPQKPQKDPYFDERRQIERIRTSDPTKAAELQDELEKKIILDQKQRDLEVMKQKFQQAQKQMEQAKRQDHTIIVYCLPLKAKEKHIWKFFYDSGCGKIRDIRIIKDNRSGKSKGVAYVQFYTSDSVQKALLMAQKPFQLRGRYFTSLKVHHSQAEKNRAAAAAKQMKLIKPVDPLEQERQTMKREMKVMVGGLDGKLAQIQQSQLKHLFDPFGLINYVDIHRDPQTGKCKGFAFIQFNRTEDAKQAVKSMNNLEISGQKITVQTVSTAQKFNVTAGDQYLYNSGNKTALMNKLSRDAPSSSNLRRPPISTVSTPYIVLSNLFKMENTTPKYFQDLKKQVQAKCSQFGIIEKCFIEKNNQGNVWIKFSDTQSAVKAQQNMNGQFFDNVKIFCYFVAEQTYQERVGI